MPLGAEWLRRRPAPVAESRPMQDPSPPGAPACPFCSLPAERIADANALAFVILDAFPVSPGHRLVITRRHVGSFFETTAAERQALLELLERAREAAEHEHAPAGYNVGINDGAAAGQTVPHLHIHLIPRYEGDCADPRGGVRWVVPEHADDWSGRGPG